MANAAAASKRKKDTESNRRARSKRPESAPLSVRLQDAISIAEGKGLLRGGRTLMVRGRMPAALVAHAKQKTGISSDSKLLEAALANIAVADDYGDWLISQRNTIGPELDLEF
ncbi:MAG TPA: hypothetical protein VF865_01885 [Acidobacteriaceae bacterium]